VFACSVIEIVQRWKRWKAMEANPDYDPPSNASAKVLEK
jgi:hypothetical protein